jgi:hypothetical protein
MTLTVGALAVGAAIGLLTGGCLRHVAGRRLSGWWLLLGGLVLSQAAARMDLGVTGTVWLVAGYACLLAFAAMNRTLVGMGIVALGLAANTVVIAANGGMPVRSGAVVSAGIVDGSTAGSIDYGRLHHLEGKADRLGWLGDIIPVRPFHEVLSFGDLVLAVGAADVVAHLLHRRRRPPTVVVPAALLRARAGLELWAEPSGPGRVPFDRQAVGQPLDVLPEVPAVTAKRDHVAQFAVARPPADGFGRNAQDGRCLGCP